MIDLIKQVIHLRLNLAIAKAEKERLMLLWTSEHGNLLEGIALFSQQLTEAEATLRAAAIEAYKATGNKTPGPGLAIKIMTRLEYELKDALTWAIEHKMALKLDSSAFEKIAKTTTLEFVRVDEEPMATIATDLDKALANPAPAGGKAA